MQRGVVDENAVRVLAVFAERLAVIAGDDDQRLGAHRRQRAEQTIHRPIRHRDLIVVPLERRTSRSRVAVRRVRFEEVDPQEEGGWGLGAGGMIRGRCLVCSRSRAGATADCRLTTGDRGLATDDCGEPRDRFVDDLGAWAFVGKAAVRGARKAIAVDVEAAVETELMIEREGGDEGAGPEAARVQFGRERRHARRHVHAVVAGAVAGRVAAAHQRRV